MRGQTWRVVPKGSTTRGAAHVRRNLVAGNKETQPGREVNGVERSFSGHLRGQAELQKWWMASKGSSSDIAGT